MSKVIVVGGGAAGMMAAYAAGMCGHEVTLLEKMKSQAKRFISQAKEDVTSLTPAMKMTFSRMLLAILSFCTALFILLILIP